MKRQLKRVLGALIYRTGMHRRLLRDRAVIALFHRVDDRLRGNPITCTTGEFRAFCAFFSRYFTVVSLGQLLDKLDRGEHVGGHLVITFDDGYKDNTRAAAELERWALPACFFVATNFIESNHVPWWDAERSIASEWMSWDDVRRLLDNGFEIGSHTMNHVDLGKVDGDEAKREIVQSAERLRAELGTDVPFFSYPYGRPWNVTAANRERVRRAGYRCCLSAHGGTVRPPVNMFELKREPVSAWHISPYQFGFEVLLREFRPTYPSAV
ncbi:MAG: polysaccharide deacetylase family protein [Gemmatimonadaceae bacterium]